MFKGLSKCLIVLHPGLFSVNAMAGWSRTVQWRVLGCAARSVPLWIPPPRCSWWLHLCWWWGWRREQRAASEEKTGKAQHWLHIGVDFFLLKSSCNISQRILNQSLVLHDHFFNPYCSNLHVDLLVWSKMQNIYKYDKLKIHVLL